MLKPAIEYKEELQQKIKEALEQDEIAFSYYNPTYIFENIKNGIAVEKNTMHKHQFVSVFKGEVIGYITYNISLFEFRAYNFKCINFTNNTLIFGKDLKQTWEQIFNMYKLRKLTLGVFDGNPFQKSCDRIVEICGGRTVGVYKEHLKLADGKYHDLKLYEVLRKDFIKATGGKK